MNPSLLPIIPPFEDVLFNFAQSDDFWANLATAFGTSYDLVKATELRNQWQSRNFSQLPPIEVLSDEVLGTAKGAYAVSTNKIYLSESFLNVASSESLVKVILEEIGHYVDAQINPVDSAGDEGAIFAELVQGNSLDVATLDALRAENDQTTIIVNGEIIQVEQADFTGTNGNDNITGTSGNDTISPLRGYDIVDGGAGNDLLIVDYSSNTYTGENAGIVSSPGYFKAFYDSNSNYDYVQHSNIERFQITGTIADDWIDIGWNTNTLKVNGGAGFDTLRYGDFSSLTKAVMINELGTTTINLNNGTSISNIEWFYSFKTGSGNDIVSLTEHLDNNINTGSGDDTVNAGGGYNVVDGGAGNDLLIVDYSSNTYTGENAGIVSSPGYFKAFYDSNSNYDYVQHSNIERFQITGTLVADYIVTDSGNDTINNRAGDDYISSGAGNDYLNGEAGNDELYGGNNNDTLQGTNSGTGEYDYLEGGTGNDRFILADTTKTFYDDGNATNAGTSDYARIADFNTTDDIIQLQGSSSDYLLTVSGSNTNLYINKPGSEPDELIAYINNQTALSLTASYFSYVSSPTLPSITLAVSPASVTEDGTTNLVYTFTRSGVTTNALTVNYTLGGTATLNTDYTRTGTNNTVTFAANSSTATVTVDPTADTTVESNETVALTLATGTGYTVGTTTPVTGTITNDDVTLPSITLSLNYRGISENSPSNFVYTFTRTGVTTNALTVKYNIAGTASANDYTGATPGNGKTITFNPGSTTTSITINPTADTVVEPNETISLQLAAGTGYSIGTTAAQIATIINDDGTRRHVGTNGKDVLLGTNANDYLIGGAGNDILTGGTGGDIFYFASSNLGNDAITDFTPGQDFIQVSGQGFGGGLMAGDTITQVQFLIGSSATNASQRFIYNSTSGALLFDVDGNGIQSAQQIATLNTGLALTYEDIFVS